MNITILGTELASLTAIAKVRKKLPNADIRVIAPSDEFIYYPSLIWIQSLIICDFSISKKAN